MDPTKVSRLFRRDGFVTMKAFLSESECGELNANLSRFIGERVPTLPREHVFYEDRSRPDTLKQIQQLHTHDSYFETLMVGSRFEDLAKCALADEVIPKNMQYFNKPPLAGLPTPPHQDGYYFKLDPCEAVTLWLALDDVDEENGCVHYARGSHELGLLPHDRTSTLGFSQGLRDCTPCENADTDVVCPAEPGDLLAHHALTIHWAGGNRSATRTRRALGFIFYAASAREDTAVHEAYQKSLAQEMAEQGKI